MEAMLMRQDSWILDDTANQRREAYQQSFTDQDGEVAAGLLFLLSKGCQNIVFPSVGDGRAVVRIASQKVRRMRWPGWHKPADPARMYRLVLAMWRALAVSSNVIATSGCCAKHLLSFGI